ncbi:XRE family transcriptional regulator [Pseudomonas sp. J237]|nr:XRE family transcriptional regulator [Pseudomonas sp. J237]
MLAELRRNRQLSQEELGFEANFDRTFISLLERGRRSPTLDTIFSLCRALDIPISQLALLIEAKLDEMNA